MVHLGGQEYLIERLADCLFEPVAAIWAWWAEKRGWLCSTSKKKQSMSRSEQFQSVSPTHDKTGTASSARSTAPFQNSVAPAGRSAYITIYFLGYRVIYIYN